MAHPTTAPSTKGINLATIWQAAGDLCLRKQSVRHRSPLRLRRRQPRCGRPRPSLWLAERDCGWQRCAGRLRSGRGSRRPRPLRRWPHPDRVQNLSHPRPRRRDARGRLSHPRRDRQWKARDPITMLRNALVERAGSEDLTRSKPKLISDRMPRTARGQALGSKTPPNLPRTAPEPDPADDIFYLTARYTSVFSNYTLAASHTMREITFIEATREGTGRCGDGRRPHDLCRGRGHRQARRQLQHHPGPLRQVWPGTAARYTDRERGFVGMCTGAAMTGTRPVVDAMYFEFALDAMGELINQTAKMQYMSSGRLKMPILLRGCIGIGHSAATHHSGSYYPIFAHIPGFRVAMPSNAYDAKGLFHHRPPLR